MAAEEAPSLILGSDELLARPREALPWQPEQSPDVDGRVLADVGQAAIDAADARRHLWRVAAENEFRFENPAVQAALTETAPHLLARDSAKFIGLANETLDYHEEADARLDQLRSYWIGLKIDRNLYTLLREQALQPVPPSVLSNEWIIGKVKAFVGLPRKFVRFFHEASEEQYNKVVTRTIIGGIAVAATAGIVVSTVLAARGLNTPGDLTHHAAALGNHFRPPVAAHGHEAHSGLLSPSRIVGRHTAPRTEQLPDKVKPGEYLWGYMHRAGVPTRKIMGDIAIAIHKSGLPYHKTGAGDHIAYSVDGDSTTKGMLAKIGRFITWPSRR